MYSNTSKHSALGSRILGINRNNDVIFPLETNKMAKVLREGKVFCGAEKTLCC